MRQADIEALRAFIKTDGDTEDPFYAPDTTLRDTYLSAIAQDPHLCSILQTCLNCLEDDGAGIQTIQFQNGAAAGLVSRLLMHGGIPQCSENDPIYFSVGLLKECKRLNPNQTFRIENDILGIAAFNIIQQSDPWALDYVTSHIKLTPPPIMMFGLAASIFPTAYPRVR